MARNFYAVKRGYDKKKKTEIKDVIFSDWDDVRPLVKDYDDARYKGFDTEEEAKAWLSVVDKTDAEKRAKKTIDQAKKDIGIEESDTDTHTLADEYSEALEKLVKEYKKLGWDRLATIGNLTSIIVKEVENIYRR